jgi:hypothetical protein
MLLARADIAPHHRIACVCRKAKRAVVEHDDEFQRTPRLNLSLAVTVDPASGKRGHDGSFLLEVRAD